MIGKRATQKRRTLKTAESITRDNRSTTYNQTEWLKKLQVTRYCQKRGFGAIFNICAFKILSRPKKVYSFFV